MSNITIDGIYIPIDIKVLSVEIVQVAEAVARITAEDIVALSACPPHSESLRDGYVLGRSNAISLFAKLPSKGAEEECENDYPVVGEIAAGSRKISILEPGTACRIFTGGLIPEGGVRVVPQEDCCEVSGRVRVAAAAMISERCFINNAGSQVTCGEKVISQGTRLEVDHLALLAAVGVHQVNVVTRPRVACFCTGSELVAVGGRLESGQKLSLNSLLLQNLIPRYGGVVAEQGIIFDNHLAITKIFDTLTDEHCHLVVSTGGMGPGKYDLVKNAFCDAGGRIILETLPMHPGRSILLGTLGGTIFIALPGPPNAVRTLINELVGPILLMMQGAKRCWPKALPAMLLEDLQIRKSDLLQVKGGVFSVDQGICCVRLAERLEPISCFILFAAGKKEYGKGDMIEVHLAVTSADSAVFQL